MGYLYRRNSARWNRVNIYDPTSSKACATVRTYTFVAKLCHGASNELRPPIPSRAQVDRRTIDQTCYQKLQCTRNRCVRCVGRCMANIHLNLVFCSHSSEVYTVAHALDDVRIIKPESISRHNAIHIAVARTNIGTFQDCP